MIPGEPQDLEKAIPAFLALVPAAGFFSFLVVPPQWDGPTKRDNAAVLYSAVAILMLW